VNKRMMLKVTTAFGALMIAALSLLMGSSAALAVQTSQYDAFTACPTNHPTLNDPASEFAICVAVSSNGGSLQIGGKTLSVSRLGVQFGATAITARESDCALSDVCFGRVPGSTSVESEPSVIPVNPGRGKAGRDAGSGKGAAQKLKITILSAGDVISFSPGFLFRLPIPVFKLPVKLDLEAPWLGDDCRVGSNANRCRPKSSETRTVCPLKRSPSTTWLSPIATSRSQARKVVDTAEEPKVTEMKK
jgi:hypothetical protein